jgi:two-component system cell cycle response regulator CtrA
MRVLLVQNELATARSVMQVLKANGGIVDHVDSGEEALELVRHYDYDIVLLDLMLPDMDGYEVVRRMRSNRIEAPVIVMSSLSRPQDKVKAFGVGADDFITKPFDSTELVARMKAIVRRSKGYSQPTLRVGALQLNLESREVLVSGEPVHLTGKEYAMLELMVLRKGTVLTKEAFLNHLYGGMDEPEVKIIDVFICKLRKKLAAAGAGDIIGTVWGRGYTVRDQAKPSVPNVVLSQLLASAPEAMSGILPRPTPAMSAAALAAA